MPFFKILKNEGSFFAFVLFEGVQERIDADAEQECARDRGDDDIADRHDHTADAADENDGNGGIQFLTLYNAPLLGGMVHLFIVETVIYFLHYLPQTTAF